MPKTKTLSRIGVLVVAGAVAALSLTACGSDGTSAEPAGGVTDSASAAPSAASTPTGKPASSGSTGVVVPEALNFTAKTVSGASFDGSSVAGKPVVLWFWAPWCAVCRSQGPQVQKLVADYGDDLAVIGVGSLDSGSAISGFAADVSGPLHLSDPDGALWKRFGISEQSSFVVLDAAGKEVLRTGYNDDDKLTATVQNLLG